MIPIRRHAPTFNTYLATAEDGQATAAAEALAQLVQQHFDSPQLASTLAQERWQSG